MGFTRQYCLAQSSLKDLYSSVSPELLKVMTDFQLSNFLVPMVWKPYKVSRYVRRLELNHATAFNKAASLLYKEGEEPQHMSHLKENYPSKTFFFPDFCAPVVRIYRRLQIPVMEIFSDSPCISCKSEASHGMFEGESRTFFGLNL